MPHARVGDVNLFYEETGAGTPLIFVHEFAGDYRSWESQVRFFSRRYRAIAFNARGYPPSDVPKDVAAYSQDQAVDDIKGVLDHLGIAFQPLESPSRPEQPCILQWNHPYNVR